MIEVYINDTLVDLLSSGVDIGIDYENFDISKLGERGGLRSYSISLPKTDRNKAVFKSSEIVNNLSEFPYQIIKARVEVDGLDILVRFCELESINDKYNIRLYGMNTDFFTPLADLKLWDMDFSDYDHIWTLANVTASRTNNTGYIYAVIDYHSDSPNAFIGNVNTIVDIRYMPLSMFVNTILEKIFSYTDFELINDVEEDSSKMIMPLCFNGVEEQTSFISEKYNAVFGINDRVELISWLNGGSLDDYFQFDTISGYAGLYYDLPYTAPLHPAIRCLRIEDRIFIQLDYSLDVTITNPSNQFTVQAILFYENGTQAPLSPFTFLNEPIGTNTYTFSHPVLNLQFPQQPIYIAVRILNNSFNTDPIYLENTSTITVSDAKAFASLLEFNNFLPVTALMPDMTQATFIKNYLLLFGLLPVVDYLNNKVYFLKFSEIKANIGKAYDWSSKVDKTEEPELKFVLGDYAQNNILDWEHDGEEIAPDGTTGNIQINNKNIPAEKKIVQLDIACTPAVIRLDGKEVPQVGVYKDATFGNNKLPRWLQMDKQTLAEFGGTSLFYTDGTSTNTISSNIPMCYFIKNGEDFNLGFGNNMQDNYFNDLQEMITKVKDLTIAIRLTSSDINQLDFTVPVYLSQYESYFYINKIEGYSPNSNTSCLVELVKLNL